MFSVYSVVLQLEVGTKEERKTLSGRQLSSTSPVVSRVSFPRTLITYLRCLDKDMKGCGALTALRSAWKEAKAQLILVRHLHWSCLYKGLFCRQPFVIHGYAQSCCIGLGAVEYGVIHMIGRCSAWARTGWPPDMVCISAGAMTDSLESDICR